QIREGSEATDESVIDLASGKPLKFDVVTGAQAKVDSPTENFPAAAHYIKVLLAHPVPAGGEYRLAIIKTYKDDKSYFIEGDQIVFKRPLGIPRDSVVLPAGYEIVSCSVATQVLTEPDGRLKLAFVNPGSGGQLEVTIRARKLAAPATSNPGPPADITKSESKPATTPTQTAPATAVQTPWPFSERAYQDREILSELQSHES